MRRRNLTLCYSAEGFAVVEQLLPPLYVFLSALIFERLLVFPTGSLTASVIGKEKGNYSVG
jgi:hypothetical protein